MGAILVGTDATEPKIDPEISKATSIAVRGHLKALLSEMEISIEKQYTENRINGTDFAAVLTGAITTASQQAVALIQLESTERVAKLQMVHETAITETKIAGSLAEMHAKEAIVSAQQLIKRT